MEHDHSQTRNSPAVEDRTSTDQHQGPSEFDFAGLEASVEKAEALANVHVVLYGPQSVMRVPKRERMAELIEEMEARCRTIRKWHRGNEQRIAEEIERVHTEPVWQDAWLFRSPTERRMRRNKADMRIAVLRAAVAHRKAEAVWRSGGGDLATLRARAADESQTYSFVGGAIGFLENGDRMSTTGDGGSSKTHTGIQWAVQLASGINPMGGSSEPVPTLIVNHEYPEETLNEMVLFIDDAIGARTQAPVFVRSLPPFDIGDDHAEIADSIVRLVRAERIEFVSIGPGKSMIGPHVFGDTGRGDSRAVALRDLFDELSRLPSRPAVVAELHTPYSELRPKGGDWLGWGEWGFHFKAKDNYESLQMTEWRRPRKYRRSIEHPFPTQWTNDGSGIWRPTTAAIANELIEAAGDYYDERGAFTQTAFAEHRFPEVANPKRSLRREMEKAGLKSFDALLEAAGVN